MIINLRKLLVKSCGIFFTQNLHESLCPNCAHSTYFFLKKPNISQVVEEKNPNEIGILTEIIGFNEMVVLGLGIPCSVHF